MAQLIEAAFNERPMHGGCEVCLRVDCGREGYVSFGRVPVAIGRRCAEKIAGALPIEALPSATRTKRARTRAGRTA